MVNHLKYYCVIWSIWEFQLEFNTSKKRRLLMYYNPKLQKCGSGKKKHGMCFGFWVSAIFYLYSSAPPRLYQSNALAFHMR